MKLERDIYVIQQVPRVLTSRISMQTDYIWQDADVNLYDQSTSC